MAINLRIGAPGRTRTCNLLFRRQLLCPLSYRGVVGGRIPERVWPAPAGWLVRARVVGQVGRLRRNRARDCQDRPSTVGPPMAVAVAGGRQLGKGMGFGGPVVRAETKRPEAMVMA